MKNNTDLIKKRKFEKLNYQNTWINVNQKLLSIINEIDLAKMKLFTLLE